VFREHPSTRAICEIDICSARRNRRISAQSSTLNTHFLPGSVRARLSARVVKFRVPRPVQFSAAVDSGSAPPLDALARGLLTMPITARRRPPRVAGSTQGVTCSGSSRPSPAARSDGVREARGSTGAGQSKHNDSPRRGVIAYCQDLLHDDGGTVFLVVDGHPVHRSRAVRDFAASTNGRLRLFFLPPYSPELNPDEWVWKKVKHDRVGKTAITSFEDLQHKAETALLRMKQLPDLVRAFFADPDLHYIGAHAVYRNYFRSPW
jgi:hypothetical protein